MEIDWREPSPFRKSESGEASSRMEFNLLRAPQIAMTLRNSGEMGNRSSTKNNNNNVVLYNRSIIEGFPLKHKKSIKFEFHYLLGL